MHSRNIIHARNRNEVEPKVPETADARNILMSLKSKSNWLLNDITSTLISDRMRIVSAVNGLFIEAGSFLDNLDRKLKPFELLTF
jgi:hypothetical protein